MVYNFFQLAAHRLYLEIWVIDCSIDVARDELIVRQNIVIKDLLDALDRVLFREALLASYVEVCRVLGPEELVAPLLLNLEQVRLAVRILLAGLATSVLQRALVTLHRFLSRLIQSWLYRVALSGNHTAALVVEAAEQLEVVLLDVLL